MHVLWQRQKIERIKMVNGGPGGENYDDDGGCVVVVVMVM